MAKSRKSQEAPGVSESRHGCTKIAQIRKENYVQGPTLIILRPYYEGNCWVVKGLTLIILRLYDEGNYWVVKRPTLIILRPYYEGNLGGQ